MAGRAMCASLCLASRVLFLVVDKRFDFDIASDPFIC